MTDDDLDALLRDQILSRSPDAGWIEARVAEAHARPRWGPWLVGLAAAAVLLLAGGSALQGVLQGNPQEAGSRPGAPRLEPPDGHRLLQLPAEVDTVPGFPEAGDHVDVLVALAEPPEAVTLLTHVLVSSSDPVVLALPPDHAEKLTHAGRSGQLFLAVERDTDRSEVLLRPSSPTTAATGDRVDVLWTREAPGGQLATLTLLQDLEVTERIDGVLRVSLTPAEAERAVLASSAGEITITVHP